MVRIFQVVNLSILDTNLSFIELQNFLVNAELLYYIEIIQKIILKFYIFLQIFYLYHLRKNFKCYLNKCRLKCNLETRIFKHMYHIKITLQDHTRLEKAHIMWITQIIQNHTKLYETTRNYAKLWETTQNYAKPCKTMQNHAKLRETTRNHLIPRETTRNHAKPHETKLNHVKLPETTQNYAKPCKTTWTSWPPKGGGGSLKGDTSA